ncbi:CadC-family transcriptional regulator [Bradyrhizobium sp. CCBAU 051011]|uniref:winged helix-turn-helix domain-containing protein n=1 Tax=Bradyrhizobium sp. CCBAU 051011 TaxID=858422 RepID=UPI001373B446|nr:winged helix-turn-helix domain-containing protein [Bradyrhizobium sp. CCBAU 051011]QHO73630.1 CadC-family transcriptional regulator [Bradyrhizobium sp. CCBAU 051011]
MRYLFEDFALDTDKRELRRGIDAVSVTPQAFDVLLYLVRNRQRVVSKDDLISAIWGGRAISDAALATRLNAARAAIGDTGDQQRLIKTLQRKGFRFIGSVHEIGERDDAAAPNGALQPRLSDKPSIAVLPFQTIPARPEQEYFADGLVDDIITALSRFRTLFVIARNSSFTYKGKAVDIKHVGQELGVRYVLEGSVRKAGTRLRISAQLIDVATGAHLWADRFEGALGNVFDFQDKVALQVVGAIAPEVDRAEIDRASRRRTDNIDAVTAYYRGLPHIRFPTTPQNNEAALRHFEQAIALDPSFAPAYGGAATCIAWRRANKWPGDIVEDNAQVLRIARRLKELGTDDAMALNVVGFLLFWFALDFNGGVEMIERAIHFNPTYGPALHARGLIRGWQGESDAAVADLELALHLSPRDPFNYNAMLGLALAHHNAGRHTEAGEWADKAVRAFPPAFNVGMAQAILCYVGAGRLEDAQKLMVELLRLSPGARRSTVTAPHFSPKLRAELFEAMIKAGLPE